MGIFAGISWRGRVFLAVQSGGSGDRVPSLVMFTLTPAHLESAGFPTALFSSLCSQGVFEKARFPVSLSPASFSMHWYFLPELSN